MWERHQRLAEISDQIRPRVIETFEDYPGLVGDVIIRNHSPGIGIEIWVWDLNGQRLGTAVLVKDQELEDDSWEEYVPDRLIDILDQISRAQCMTLVTVPATAKPKPTVWQQLLVKLGLSSATEKAMEPYKGSERS